MEELKNNFALMTIFLDFIDDFLLNSDFNHELKYRANIARKNIKWILDKSYGNEPMEEMDVYKEEIIKSALKIIGSNFILKK